jgi:hypothetical protein
MRDSRSWVWLACVLSGFAFLNSVPAVANYLQLRWPDIGLGGALFIGLMAAGSSGRALDADARVTRFHWLLLLIYLIHQFEEHGVDLYGRSYYFRTYANAALEARGLELTQGAILRINTLMVWLAFLLAVWGGRRLPWPGMTAAALVLTNGLSHIAIALTRGEYNPGLASSIVLFLPVAILYFRRIPGECGLGRRAIAVAIAYGVASHALLPLMIGIDAPLIPLFLLALTPLAANAAASRWARGTLAVDG